MIGAVLKLIGVGGKVFEARQERKAKVEEAKAEREITKIRQGHNWAMFAAENSSKFLRWFFAFHVFAGLDFTIYLSVTGAENPNVIFEAFEVAPVWFQGLIATMFGWAFASEPMKNAGAKLFDLWAAKRGKG